MKLLFDENLSFRLGPALADSYPDSLQVREAGLLGASDERIWSYAAQHDFVLVSKDVDFYQRSVLYGPPPKVIWLRVGNAPTVRIAEILRAHRSLIERFRKDRNAAFLALG